MHVPGHWAANPIELAALRPATGVTAAVLTLLAGSTNEERRAALTP
jgi:hypothetical protein